MEGVTGEHAEEIMHLQLQLQAVVVTVAVAA
jgi:hypothetical protein